MISNIIQIDLGCNSPQHKGLRNYAADMGLTTTPAVLMHIINNLPQVKQAIAEAAAERNRKDEGGERNQEQASG